MKAALYTRVSTDMQAEDGFSLAGQLNLLNEYCKRSNVEVFQVYSDEGISGQKENRPAFQKMIHDAEKKCFDVILVYKFDRFARKVELSQRVKNQLKKSGINVVSITEPVEDSPIGFFTSGIMDLLAEYFVKDLSVKTKMGQVERASQGLHNGSVPYGYKIDKITGNMVINEEQANVVRLIFDLYNNKGYGSTKIALWLNENKIPSAVDGTWAHFTVSRVLKNVKYIGKIEYDGQVYEGKHEPIINTEDFEIAQKNMTSRTWKRSYRGANFEKFVLLGLLKCGYCGCAMRLSTTHTRKYKKPMFYYLCNGRDHKTGCAHSKHHQTASLEKAVFEYVKEVAELKRTDIQIRTKVNTESVLENRQKEIPDELDRAERAYLKGAFSLEKYVEIKESRAKELDEIKNYKPNNEKSVSKLAEQIKTAWQQFEAEESIPGKRKILQTFIDSILVYKEKIEIIFFSNLA